MRVTDPCGSARVRQGARGPRVLFLASSADRYGSDRALVELAARLSVLGCSVIVVAPHAGPLNQALESVDVGMTVAPLFVIERSLSARAAGSLARSLVRPRTRLLDVGRSFGPDIVYSNTSHVLDGPALARALGVPHVWHLREIERVPTLARRVFGRFLLATGARVLAISHAVLAAYYPLPGPKTVVVHDGVDVDSYRSGDLYRSPARFTTDRPLRLLSIGRMTPWKGQDVAARSARQLASAGVPVRLRIVGDAVTAGDEAYVASLRRLAESSGGAVELSGGVEDVRPMYQWCDIVLHTAVTPEPFGRVVVEAMAAGRLVVASAAGGPLETIDPGNDGYLVPPGEAEALVSTLRALASDPGRIERRAAACSKRADRFSITTTARRVCEELTAVSDQP